MLTATLSRAKAEEALQAEHGTLATLLQASDSLMIVMDPAGNIVRINRACEQASGFSNDEVHGRSAWGVLAAPEDVRRTQGMLHKVTTVHGPLGFETDLMTKRGERRRIRWSQSVMLDEHGQAQSIVVSGSDLTGQKRLENELEQSRTQSEKMQRAINDLLSQLNAGEPRSKALAAAQEGTSQPFQAVSESGVEHKRSSPRRRYAYRQLVAPMVDGVLPNRGQFSEVPFRDISAGGVSFVIDHRPAFDMVVLALGCPPNLHYVTARIVKITEEPSPAALNSCSAAAS